MVGVVLALVSGEWVIMELFEQLVELVTRDNCSTISVLSSSRGI